MSLEVQRTLHKNILVPIITNVPARVCVCVFNKQPTLHMKNKHARVHVHACTHTPRSARVGKADTTGCLVTREQNGADVLKTTDQ